MISIVQGHKNKTNLTWPQSDNTKCLGGYRTNMKINNVTRTSEKALETTGTLGGFSRNLLIQPLKVLNA